jgi:hypothetical protein
MNGMIPPSFHLAGFFGSVAASQTDIALTPFSDGYLSQGVSGLLLPDDMMVARHIGLGLGLTQYLLNVPSLRQISQPRYGTVNKALLAVDDAPILIMGDYAPSIMRSEGYNYQVTTDATAGPNATHVFSFLTKGFKPCQRGRSTTIRATATITAVAGAWVNGGLTLAQDLPAGNYEIIGAAAYGTGLQAVRFRLPGAGYAPGIIAEQAPGEFFLNNQRWGQMGSFGSFQNSLVPTIDITGTAGAITITMFIDIVKVG